MNTKLYFATILSSFILMGCGGNNSTENNENADKVALGKLLFNDTSLSLNKTMSCATCHVIDKGFVDPRATNLALGASLGDDGVSIGDRNAPTAGYAQFTPLFHFDSTEGLYIGGQFLDGRATSLTKQAQGPFLNPVEMKMPNATSVVNRVEENANYVQTFKKIYGEDIFNDKQSAYVALADAIASFEKTSTFAPFNSKFDKYRNGEETLSASEQRGLVLFNGKAECVACHVSEGKKALFTDFSYDNLGVPVNHALRNANGKGATFVDNGLYENPQVNDPSLKGAFRVSTLRNIAVTGPYMHNGVFKNLATVIHFYNTRDVPGAINPETGNPWEAGEVDANKNTEELGDLKLTSQEEEDLLAFMKTLTDEQYEHLIP